jgi:hypothetical protein
MAKAVIAFALLFLSAVTLNSCKKTTESQLVNGLWQLNTVNIDTSTSNYLSKYPNFGGSCCGYKLSFQQSDVLFAYYISNDSVKNLYTGTWTVSSYNDVYMKVDSFIDGTFTIDRTTLSHWVLTSNHNHIAAFDNGVNPQFDTTYTKLDMTR